MAPARLASNPRTKRAEVRECTPGRTSGFAIAGAGFRERRAADLTAVEQTSCRPQGGIRHCTAAERISCWPQGGVRHRTVAERTSCWPQGGVRHRTVAERASGWRRRPDRVRRRLFSERFLRKWFAQSAGRRPAHKRTRSAKKLAFRSRCRRGSRPCRSHPSRRWSGGPPPARWSRRRWRRGRSCCCPSSGRSRRTRGAASRRSR